MRLVKALVLSLSTVFIAMAVMSIVVMLVEFLFSFFGPPMGAGIIIASIIFVIWTWMWWVFVGEGK